MLPPPAPQLRLQELIVAPRDRQWPLLLSWLVRSALTSTHSVQMPFYNNAEGKSSL